MKEKEKISKMFKFKGVQSYVRLLKQMRESKYV